MKKSKIDIKRIIKKKIENRHSKLNFIEKRNSKMNIGDMLKSEMDSEKKPIRVGLSNKEQRLDIKLGLKVNYHDINNIDEYSRLFEYNLINPNIKILFLISNYMRKKMLLKLINEINSFNNLNMLNISLDYLIFDDKSTYVLDDKRFIINDEHRGKEFYWKTFNEMFQKCREIQYDVYCFTPNDFLCYDFMRIVEYASQLNDFYYIFNIINDGRTISWLNNKPIRINDEVNKVFFTDCGFFTNKKTLEKLDFTINPISLKRFSVNEISSGVGRQLTQRTYKLGIPIFTPLKSIAYHGEHKSLMNPIERIKNNLKSIN